MIRSFLSLCFVLALATAVEAQNRTRLMHTLQSGDSKVTIKASSKHGVEIYATDELESILIWASPDMVTEWVADARKFIANPPKAGPGEEVEEKTPSLFGSGNNLQIMRKVKGARSSYVLWVSDEYIVETVYIPLSRARIIAFVDALERAATAAEGM